MLLGTAISWKANLQAVVALLTTKAKYIAVTEAIKEAIWLITEELGLKQKCVKVSCDNQSTIHLTKNQMFHKRTKHIDVRGTVVVVKISIEDNLADMITKAITTGKFRDCLKLINVQECSSPLKVVTSLIRRN